MTIAESIRKRKHHHQFYGIVYSILYSILFYSLLYSLFYSILYSILFYSILYSILLFYSILFMTIANQLRKTKHKLLYCILNSSSPSSKLNSSQWKNSIPTNGKKIAPSYIDSQSNFHFFLIFSNRGIIIQRIKRIKIRDFNKSKAYLVSYSLTASSSNIKRKHQSFYSILLSILFMTIAESIRKRKHHHQFYGIVYSILYSILFYSLLYSLFYSILYSILFYSILYSILLFYSILFMTIANQLRKTKHKLLYCILNSSSPSSKLNSSQWKNSIPTNGKK